MKKHKKFIGIDPDVTKSGIAFYEKDTKKVELSNLSFFDLFDYLSYVKKLRTLENDVLVVIEGGWLNKSNWHTIKGGNSSINAQIGQRTGANHETGKKIVEMCDYLNLDFEVVKPTKSKVTHDFVKNMCGIIGRTNQEQRDALMLVYGR